MVSIIRGTTPTIKYTFETVNVADITVAYLTAEQDGSKIIEKQKSAGTVGDKYIAWTLTQEETLLFAAESVAYFMCNWRKADGTRGASKAMSVMIVENQKAVVI